MTSLILVTHNSLSYLKDCLAQIEINTLCPYELIIVDNASNDGSVEWLRNYAKGTHSYWMTELKIIYNMKNRFFTKAVNQGIQKVKSDVIAIINADVLVTAYWLPNMLRLFEDLPNAAAIGPMIGGGTQKSHYYGQDYEALYGKILKEKTDEESLQQIALELKKQREGRYSEAKVLCFACVVLRKAALKEIGVMDEGFILSGDDWEWCLRARAKGYRLYVAEDVFVLHYLKGSIRTLPQTERAALKKADQEHWVNILYQYHNPRTMPKNKLTFGQIYGKQMAFLDVSHTHPELKRLLTWNDLFANGVGYYYSNKKGNSRKITIIGKESTP